MSSPSFAWNPWNDKPNNPPNSPSSSSSPPPLKHNSLQPPSIPTTLSTPQPPRPTTQPLIAATLPYPEQAQQQSQQQHQRQEQQQTYAPPIGNKPWSRSSTLQQPTTQNDHQARNNRQDFDNAESTYNESNTLTWSQRLNNITIHRRKSQGFIWDSLDNSMEDMQIARKTRKNGTIRLITKRKDTSYNVIRSTLRLQYAEKRKSSDIRNLVSSIRLSLDYDVYKARMMALLNSKARTIFFVSCLSCW
ncbi:hypothetical protein BKA57DRAFT_37908 [Linnemannia elongata]|nr:hypothetical protein BKA57DRAFT_37908 [Linnemannia elongata]